MLIGKTFNLSPVLVQYLALHPRWDCKTPPDCLLFQMKICKTEMSTHQTWRRLEHISHGAHIRVCRLLSLCKSVVVRVVSRRGRGEEFAAGHQAGGVWRRLGLALRELEGPLVGHLLSGLGVVSLSRERVHPVTKQTV